MFQKKIVSIAIIIFAAFLIVCFINNVSIKKWLNENIINRSKGKIEMTDNLLNFSMSDYEWEIENFATEGNVGKIENRDVAIQKAKMLWMEIYGKHEGKPFDPTRGNDINVFYNSEKDCWLVEGTLSENTLGAVPFLLVYGNGDLIAVGMR